jgi:hypothetical protein
MDVREHFKLNMVRKTPAANAVTDACRQIRHHFGRCPTLAGSLATSTMGINAAYKSGGAVPISLQRTAWDIDDLPFDSGQFASSASVPCLFFSGCFRCVLRHGRVSPIHPIHGKWSLRCDDRQANHFGSIPSASPKPTLVLRPPAAIIPPLQSW